MHFDMRTDPVAIAAADPLLARLGWLFGDADFEPLEVALHIPLLFYTLPFFYNPHLFNISRTYSRIATLMPMPWVWGLGIVAVLLFHATTAYLRWRVVHLVSMLALFGVYVGLAGLFILGTGIPSPGALFFVGNALIAAWAFIRDIRRYAYWSVFQRRAHDAMG